MLYKNLDDKRVRKVIRLRKMYNFIAAFKFVLSGQLDNAKAVFRAHKEFNRLCVQYSAIRQENLNATLLNDIPEVYKGNIIKDYYLKGKKEFSGLDFPS